MHSLLVKTEARLLDVLLCPGGSVVWALFGIRALLSCWGGGGRFIPSVSVVFHHQLFCNPAGVIFALVLLLVWPNPRGLSLESAASIFQFATIYQLLKAARLPSRAQLPRAQSVFLFHWFSFGLYWGTMWDPSLPCSAWVTFPTIPPPCPPVVVREAPNGTGTLTVKHREFVSIPSTERPPHRDRTLGFPSDLRHRPRADAPRGDGSPRGPLPCGSLPVHGGSCCGGAFFSRSLRCPTFPLLSLCLKSSQPHLQSHRFHP